MTQRLYYTDSYLTDFTATVEARGDEGRRIYLDRTAFYPTSGGQPNDLGSLAGKRVLDVIDEGERIVHLVEEPVQAEQVQGSVNWTRRFDHMQQHTGQHLLSAVLADAFGYQTVSVHFGADSSSLDLDVGTMRPEQVREAEVRANAVVFENRPVTIAFEEAGTASGLRKASDRSGTLRVITIADLDRSACGGTHVRATGEIGSILIRSVERVKKQVRLEFLCGGRAVRRARADYEALSGMAESASAGMGDLPELFAKQRVDLKLLDNSRRGLEEELNKYLARDLYHATPAASNGNRVIVQRLTGQPIEKLRGLAQAIITHPRALFVGTLDSPPTLLLASSADSDVDAGATLKPVLEKHGGRGGGSQRIGQGTEADTDTLNRAVQTLVSTLTS
ncbi:MAG TPA: alanyl-tRNA editing protein [Gemmatimonadales bacterium]|nr:alanyl-tRNA editing protein [Gemmatimonadales bacterium]